MDSGGADSKPTLDEPRHSGWQVGRMVAVVFVVALVLRLWWASWAVVTPVSDFFGYDFLARQLLETGQLVHSRGHAYRTPGYPGFLAGIYAIWGHDLRAVAVVQGVLGALTAGLLAWLGARVAAIRVGLVAGLLYAVSPVALAYTPVLASEHVALPLLVGGVLLLTFDVGRWWGLLTLGGAGLLLGLGILTRPALVFVVPAFAVLALYHPLGRRWRPFGLAALCVGVALPLAPWIERNVGLGLGPTLSTAGGVNLWMANNPRSTRGGYTSHTQIYGKTDVDPALLAMAGGDEHERRAVIECELNRKYMAAARTWIGEHPGRYLALCGVRAARHLGTLPDDQAVCYLVPTAENDALLLAQRKLRRGKDVPDHVLEGAAELRRTNTKLLQRARRVGAPAVLLALTLCLQRWRRYAFVLLPFGCYVLGTTGTFFTLRLREQTAALTLIPLAALLLDVFVGGAYVGRRPKRVVKAAVLVAMLLATWGADRLRLLGRLYEIAPTASAAEVEDAFRVSDSEVGAG